MRLICQLSDEMNCVNPSADIKSIRNNVKVNPILYHHHPFPSMPRFAEHLQLCALANRSCASYYRQIRLLHEYYDADPASLSEEQIRSYFLYLRSDRAWASRTIRLFLTAAKRFYLDMLDQSWKLFDLIRLPAAQSLPDVLSLDEVIALFNSFRFFRYLIPVKLLYLCGLRLEECLTLTIDDVLGDDGKLMIRCGKGNRDRMVPLCPTMLVDLRRYWLRHRNPRWLFPSCGRGPMTSSDVSKRMGANDRPMAASTLQNALYKATLSAGIKTRVHCHVLRHSYATHLIERQVPVHHVQRLLGHASIETTALYLHVTHHTESNTLSTIESLAQLLRRMPRSK